MDPRISFSNDFVDAHQTLKHENTYREAPVSTDFEFSVNNNSMIPADEVFFQGMLLPMRVHCTTRKKTLRDELLVDGDYGYVLPKVTRNSSWLKERLGLKRSTAPKENNSSKSVLQSLVEAKTPTYVQDSSSEKLFMQEVFYEGGLSCRNSRNVVPIEE